LHCLKIHSKIAHKNPNIRASSLLKRNSCAFEAFIDDLEQLPLLRIHVSRFEIIDSKEGVLKLADILLQEITAFGVHHPGAITFWVVESVGVETSTRHIALPGALVDQHLPEVVGGGDTSREATGWNWSRLAGRT
jgi:hypothetical protein